METFGMGASIKDAAQNREKFFPLIRTGFTPFPMSAKCPHWTTLLTAGRLLWTTPIIFHILAIFITLFLMLYYTHNNNKPLP